MRGPFLPPDPWVASAAERTALIQRLVSLAVENRTALDTVASRLLLAALPQDVTALAALG